MRTTLKKVLCAILIASCLVTVLASCGSNSQAEQTPSTPAAVSGGADAAAPAQAAGGEFVFEAGGTTIAVNDDMSDVLASLGEPLSYFEAASCAFEGLDKTYTYSGFQIVTRPEGDSDFINSILLTDDSAATPEGIYIGCSSADVIAAYGEGDPTEVDWVLNYTRGDCIMSFILENDKVISIEYMPV